MPAFLIPITPTLSQIAGLFAVLVIAGALVALGAAAVGRHRRPEADLVSGWGLVIATFTLAGTANLISFSALAAFVAVIALAAMFVTIRREGRYGPPGALRLLILAAPLLALVASMTPTQWDELTQWLPNARYLVEYDSFPRTGLPKSPSVFPAYPYGLPLIIFLASRATGYLVENAAAIFNVLLFLSFGLFVARTTIAMATISRADRSARDAIDRVRMGWGACAFAGLVVTAFNPTYVSRLVFSSYADAPTAIAVGFACVLTWLTLNALSEGDDSAAVLFAWQAGLSATAAIGLKQVNLVFLIALILSAGLIVLRDPTIRWRQLLRIAPYALVVPLVVYGAWRLHVSLQSGGEFSVRPVSGWFLASIPEIIGKMALVASKKGGYFVIMSIAVLLALRAAWRPRTVFDRLTILTAVMFLAYNGFLLFAYVAAFGKDDALRVASFWRYNTHLGGVCLVFATCAVALLWGRFIQRPLPQLVGAVAVVLVLVLPVAMGKKLRFDLNPRYAYAYATAGDIARLLSRKDRLMLVDPADDGQYLVIMRYKMHGSAPVVGEINAWSRPTVSNIRKATRASGATHVWIYAPSPVVAAAFDITLAQGSSYLLAHGEHGWSAVHQWAQPDGASPLQKQ